MNHSVEGIPVQEGNKQWEAADMGSVPSPDHLRDVCKRLSILFLSHRYKIDKGLFYYTLIKKI